MTQGESMKGAKKIKRRSSTKGLLAIILAPIGGYVGGVVIAGDAAIQGKEYTQAAFMWGAAGAIVFTVIGAMLGEKFDSLFKEKPTELHTQIVGHKNLVEAVEPIDRLEQLFKLTQQGALTQDEYEV